MPSKLAIIPAPESRPSVAAGSPELDAELRRFSMAMVHELRAPIAAISGFAQGIQEALDASAPEKARHYLRRICAASEQLDAYVGALANLSQASQTVLRLCGIDVTAAASEILDRLRAAEPSREVVLLVQPGMRAHGDAALVHMVLENLLSNAWKFSAPCARTEISVSCRPGAGWQSVYCVRDAGVGFDPAYAGRLFGDFARLHSHSEFPGTGLGLANVRRIVARHGGHVWAESTPGEGAAFYFTLAARSDTAKAEHASGTRCAAPVAGSPDALSQAERG